MDAECVGNRRKLIFTKYLHQVSYLFNAYVHLISVYLSGTMCTFYKKVTIYLPGIYFLILPVMKNAAELRPRSVLCSVKVQQDAGSMGSLSSRL